MKRQLFAWTALMTLLLLNLPGAAAEETSVPEEDIVVVVTIEVPLEVVGWDEEDEVDIESHARQFFRQCDGTVSGIFGGSQDCEKTWSLHSGDETVSFSFEISWAFLASGTQTFKMRDPVGVYLVGGCSAPFPAISSSDITCDAGFLRSFIFVGTQTFDVTHTYNRCLNPLTLFSCYWKNQAEIRVNM